MSKFIARGPADRKDRRHHRVVELLRKELTFVIQREVKDPRLNPFTLTEIELTPDLRSAKIYVCRFMTGDGTQEPTLEEQEALVEGLQSASHFIYERLKKRLSMKQIPRLRFEYDFRLKELSHIWNLARRVQDGDVQEEGVLHGVG